MNVPIVVMSEKVKWPFAIAMHTVCFWLKPMATNADVSNFDNLLNQNLKMLMNIFVSFEIIFINTILFIFR